MSPAARQYELVYVLSPEASDQEVAALHTEIEGIVARFEGRIDKTENWGKRRLAYEIAHFKEGTYVLELITGSGDLVKEIDRRLRVTDNVIRHLVVRVDEDLKVADRRTAERREHRERRRAARGQTGEPAGPEPAAPAEAPAETPES